jgi:hypothetical protein
MSRFSGNAFRGIGSNQINGESLSVYIGQKEDKNFNLIFLCIELLSRDKAKTKV